MAADQIKKTHHLYRLSPNGDGGAFYSTRLAELRGPIAYIRLFRIGEGVSVSLFDLPKLERKEPPNSVWGIGKDSQCNQGQKVHLLQSLQIEAYVGKDEIKHLEPSEAKRHRQNVMNWVKQRYSLTKERDKQKVKA